MLQSKYVIVTYFQASDNAWRESFCLYLFKLCRSRHFYQHFFFRKKVTVLIVILTRKNQWLWFLRLIPSWLEVFCLVDMLLKPTEVYIGVLDQWKHSQRIMLPSQCFVFGDAVFSECENSCRRLTCSQKRLYASFRSPNDTHSCV